MKLNELAEQCDFLAEKIEALSMGFESVTVALKEINKVEEALEVSEATRPLLMLPAPEKKMGGKNKLCPVCRKFCKKGLIIHEKCKEKQKP